MTTCDIHRYIDFGLCGAIFVSLIVFDVLFLSVCCGIWAGGKGKGMLALGKMDVGRMNSPDCKGQHKTTGTHPSSRRRPPLQWEGGSEPPRWTTSTRPGKITALGDKG